MQLVECDCNLERTFPFAGWRSEAGFGVGRYLRPGEQFVGVLRGLYSCLPAQCGHEHLVLGISVGCSFWKPLESSRSSCLARALHLRGRENNRRGLAKGKSSRLMPSLCVHRCFLPCLFLHRALWPQTNGKWLSVSPSPEEY